MHAQSFQAKRLIRIVVIVGVLWAACVVDSPSAESQSTARFSTILDRHIRATFRAVAEYVTEHPTADDVEQASRWLFETARKHGLEADAVSVAENYLKHPPQQGSFRSLAQQVLCMGLAKTGSLEKAMLQFEEHLASASIRSPNKTVDFAIALSSQAQISGTSQLAGDVFERLSNKFFLNPYVRTLCENRLARLALAGQLAPSIGTKDLQGKQVDLADYKGKVLLVDFWATNCLPCLEEFPTLKQLYAEHHPQGFEVVGISLDPDRETIDRFQQTWKLPWRLAMSQSDRDGTRTSYRARTIPSMFLINRQGRIAYVDVRGRDLQRVVKRLLNEKEK